MKVYKKPILEIVEFDNLDVMQTSDAPPDPEESVAPESILFNGDAEKVDGETETADSDVLSGQDPADAPEVPADPQPTGDSAEPSDSPLESTPEAEPDSAEPPVEPEPVEPADPDPVADEPAPEPDEPVASDEPSTVE